MVEYNMIRNNPYPFANFNDQFANLRLFTNGRIICEPARFLVKNDICCNEIMRPSVHIYAGLYISHNFKHSFKNRKQCQNTTT